MAHYNDDVGVLLTYYRRRVFCLMEDYPEVFFVDKLINPGQDYYFVNFINKLIQGGFKGDF